MARQTFDAVLQHARRLAAAQAVRRLTDAELVDRFACRREETAFALLLERHGPMVLGVCRRVLHHDQDVEDAFQATFLVLARKAGSIRKPGAVGSWLYGVAQRIAMRAKAQAAARRTHERSAVTPPQAPGDDDLGWRELRGVIDEELARLPEKYRAPAVLCYLQGKSLAQAAQDLGWAKSSLATRLDRARELLRERLAWRGVTLSAGLLAVTLARRLPAAAVPAPLTAGTVRAVTAIVNGRLPATAVVSPQALGLAGRALPTFAATTLGTTAALVLATGLVVGAGLLSWPKNVPTPEPEAREQVRTPHPVEIPRHDYAAVGRDRYGDPLPPGAVARLGTVRFRHGAAVHEVVFAPSGAVLASASEDRVVRLWEVATGKVLHRFRGHQGPVLAVALSADGRMLASAGVMEDGVRLWDVAAEKQLSRLPTPTGRVEALALAPDGRTLAAAGAGDTVYLWDVVTGREVRHWVAGWHGPAGRRESSEVGPRRVAFSPDGRSLAVCLGDGTVSLWDPDTAAERCRFVTDAFAVPAVAFAPPGTVLAAAARDHVLLWDVTAAREVRRFPTPTGAPRAVAFAPDGKTLACGTADNQVYLWETASGKPCGRYVGHQGPVDTVAFAPDGKTLASGGDDHTIRLWDTARGAEVFTFAGHQGMVQAAAFAPDGRRLVTAGQDDAVRLWDVATAQEQGRLYGHRGPVHAVAFCRGGRTIATAGADGLVWLWDADTGREVRQLRGHRDAVTALAASPDGTLLVTGSPDQTIRVWDAATGQELRCFGGTLGRLIRLAFAPDGATVVSTSGDNSVRLWDVATGKELRRIGAEHHWPMSVAFSPDGRLLATGRDDGLVRLWDVRSGGLIRELRGHQFWASAVAFSPDGRLLASASYSGAIRLWDVATGRQCFRSPGHRGAVWWLAFAPDGRLLASASSDTAVLLTDVSRYLPEGR